MFKMKFIISETGWDYLERLMYRGCIGLFYETTLQGMLAYLIFGLLMLFAVIGFVCTVRALFGKIFTLAKYRNTFSYKHAHHKY